MASFASSATTCGARKHAWTKKVGENNGQLRLVRHHGWRTQARMDQKLRNFGSASEMPLVPCTAHILRINFGPHSMKV